MSLPDHPTNRNEQYLNAIATGDNSGIPAEPVTREERYLDYIAQNGGGSSGGGALVVHADENGVLDKTWQEISDAGIALINFEGNCGISALIDAPHRPDDDYYVIFAMLLFSGSGFDDPLIFTADSASGYPALAETLGGSSSDDTGGK